MSLSTEFITDLYQQIAPADLLPFPPRVMFERELPFQVRTCCGGMFIEDAQTIDPSARFGEAAILLMDSAPIETAIHELAHFVDMGWRPVPFTVPQQTARAAMETELTTRYFQEILPEQLPWEGHEQRWLRATLHLVHRARLLGHQIDVERATNMLPAFSAASQYLDSLGTEPERYVDARLAEVLDTDPPTDFLNLWTHDTRPFYERCSCKLAAAG